MIKQLTLIVAILLFTTTVWSQVIITGIVISKDDKSPIPGVNVVEKGTKNGTITNMDGEFTIEVAHSNSTLVFSFIGMVTQEYALKGQKQILVKVKWDCNKDFFDSQQITVYANSGLINNPLGGQLEIASPWLLGGVVKGLFSYQTNLDEKEFINGQLELAHYISNCDFDMDFKWSYRKVAFNNDINSKVNSFETDVNFGNFKMIAGYTHLDFNRTSTAISEISAGLLVGFGIFINIPLYPTITWKVSFMRDRFEYQADIEGGYKRFRFLIKYYKLDTFNEMSLGVGIGFGY